MSDGKCGCAGAYARMRDLVDKLDEELRGEGEEEFEHGEDYMTDIPVTSEIKAIFDVFTRSLEEIERKCGIDVSRALAHAEVARVRLEDRPPVKGKPLEINVGSPSVRAFVEASEIARGVIDWCGGTELPFRRRPTTGMELIASELPFHHRPTLTERIEQYRREKMKKE